MTSNNNQTHINRYYMTLIYIIIVNKHNQPIRETIEDLDKILEGYLIVIHPIVNVTMNSHLLNKSLNLSILVDLNKTLGVEYRETTDNKMLIPIIA